MKPSAARRLDDDQPPARPAPQQSFSFRLIRFLMRPHLGELLQISERPRALAGLIVFIEGGLALATISIAAYLTDLPMLFPPLGPSAFILLRTPMATAASPRNVILAHCLSLISGLVAIRLIGWAFPETDLYTQIAFTGPRIASLLLSMGLAFAAMIALNCPHPPAAATALIAGMGILRTFPQMVGLVLAVVVLVAQCFLIHRFLSGLPYPLWRPDPALARRYGPLAGLTDEHATFWGQLTQHVFNRRQ